MSLRSLQALCLVNFLWRMSGTVSALFRIFLTEHHWQTDSIGWMMTLGGLAGLLATMPSGLVADASRHKRAILVTCGLLITAATLLLWVFPTLYIVGFSQLVTGVSAAFIAPVLTGITLGLTGSSGFNHQMGRNEAFNHGGNMSAAILAGVLVFYLGTDAVFILMTGMAICATMAVFAIRNDDIDNRVARGLSGSADPAALPKLSVILAHPR
jgi:predicted MFS family arabinose efflux permease